MTEQKKITVVLKLDKEVRDALYKKAQESGQYFNFYLSKILKDVVNK